MKQNYVTCLTPGCENKVPMSKLKAFGKGFAHFLSNSRWEVPVCCPSCTERLNPSNSKYDDHDPSTNPDLNGKR